MKQCIKNRFIKEYGANNYCIIENYNLWRVKYNNLYELENVIFKYLHNQFFKNSDRQFLIERIHAFSDSEKRLIDTFKLKNLDVESLLKLRKAIFYLMVFKMNLKFDNHRVITNHYRA